MRSIDEEEKGTASIRGNNMGKGRWITYSAEEKKIVESGIEAIREVLMGVVEELMNSQCLKIYNETKTTETAEKYMFCEDAIIVCSSQVNSEMLVDPDKYCDALFRIKDGKVEEIGLPVAGIPYAREPLSGPFFKRVEFYYGIDLDKKECCLIYHFGPRWGRCLVYELLCHGDADYSLGEPKHVWVM